MVWWPFAPKSERADTLEVTDLHSGAPPLYSTSFVVGSFWLHALCRTYQQRAKERRREEGLTRLVIEGEQQG